MQGLSLLLLCILLTAVGTRADGMRELCEKNMLDCDKCISSGCHWCPFSIGFCLAPEDVDLCVEKPSSEPAVCLNQQTQLVSQVAAPKKRTSFCSLLPFCSFCTVAGCGWCEFTSGTAHGSCNDVSLEAECVSYGSGGTPSTASVFTTQTDNCYLLNFEPSGTPALILEWTSCPSAADIQNIINQLAVLLQLSPSVFIQPAAEICSKRAGSSSYISANDASGKASSALVYQSKQQIDGGLVSNPSNPITGSTYTVYTVPGSGNGIQPANGNHLSNGAIAGIVIGCVAGAVIIVVVIIFLVKKLKR